jgi:outer membrane lipoprotein LolB
MSPQFRAPDGGRRHAALVLLALAVSGGCTTLAPIEPAARIYTGRFSASIRRGEQREAVSGRFTLAVSSARTTLDLASPLGNTLARVEAVANRASLTAPQADGQLATWHGESPDALAESVLGYRLPVSGLADWIAGRAAAGRTALVFPATGPAQRIEQDGWLIAIDERSEQTGAPRRLSLEHGAAGDAAPSVRLRLVLDEAGGALDASDRARP